MNTKNLFLALTIVLFSLTANAQIKVWPSANSYGTLNQPPAGTKHLITGNVRFDQWTDVILDWNSGHCCGTPTLYPQNPWYFQLGTPKYYIGLGIFGHMSASLYTTYKSDSTLKQNINYNLSTFDSLLKLKPATYYYKPNILPGAPDSVLQKVCSVKEYGLIAQDVLPVFPELVDFEDSTGIYSLKYTAFISILIDAVKKQQDQIEGQQVFIENLQQQISYNQAQIDNLTYQLNNCCPGLSPNKENGSNDGESLEQQFKVNNIQNISGTENQSYLKQNIPNPFSEKTTIDYYVAEQNAVSKILIFDLNGRLLKTNNLSANKGSLVINAGELSPGMYYYTLLINNKEVDTKKMIIAE